MQNVSLQQAVKITGKSESTLRRDVKKGKVSAGHYDRRHLRFDISELQRVYGELKTICEDAQPTERDNDKAMTGHDQVEILAIKDNQIADLRNQLEKTESQLQLATTEKTKLLDLLSAEKEEKRVLMPQWTKSRNLSTGCSGTCSVRDRFSVASKSNLQNVRLSDILLKPVWVALQ